MAPTWAAPISSSGTATIRCWREPWNCARRRRSYGGSMPREDADVPTDTPHPTTTSWRSDFQLWVELFVLANIAGLIADIFLAHSANHFRRDSEYIPLYFSIA